MSTASRQALEVLQKIKEYFDGGSDVIYRDSLLFENDDSLHDRVVLVVKALDKELK